MCGISVLIDRGGHAVDHTLLGAMNDRVAHRGPDGEGVLLGPNFGLGHRRLAILDLSEAGHQPMTYEDRLVITYNGEIYNYVELRTELLAEGYRFRTNTDTEVLLAAYDYWGQGCVRRFNGMWAFAIWDRARNVLFCSRDRFGVKPLHYVELGRYFAIGSEVKQFLELPGFSPKPDETSLYRFLTADAAANVDELDFVAGVRSLRGGHNLTYDLASNRYRIERWYDLTSVAPDRLLDYSSACEQFRELFFDAVRLRLRSDVRVGVCLSGGVDSSSIACAARMVTSAPSELRTVSCVWDDPECDESRYIDAVVERYDLHAVRSRPEIKELLTAGVLDQLAYHHDQPLWSASQFAEYSVFAAARENGVVVMLDGQGADEYLAGYNWFFPPFVRSLLAQGRPWTALSEIRARSALRNSSLRGGMLSLWNALVAMPLRSRIRNALPQHGLDSWAGSRLQRVHRELAATTTRYHGSRTLRDLSLREILMTSIPQQLQSEDRNSMLHSVESRIPFLDYRLVEFGLSLPDEFKLREGATKALVRRGLHDVLPPAVRDRHDKLGFPAPEGSWIREHTSYVKRELAVAVERYPDFLRPELLTHFDRMIEKRAPYDGLFFRVVALNRWSEVFTRGRLPARAQPVLDTASSV